ncbi:sugar phosphate isomerase/epimerase [Amycolatopsis acidicola]|uniref:Sugar phosphate isomerase/epimerase n=1 Tax=Amycolatopsis acidicola TaxID=2596893 RepID=A0A5N0V333_9PSEU|nr:sugar phosphate isomerase/epimerase [Amycolatopsis acidicola]KAA9159329.1 sugar phosphate isomerase/epimerase [Amycolatopsis acidicola]
MNPIGIAHLTLLKLSPPKLVEVAAEVGYHFVGVRVRAVTAGEEQYPMAAGSPMSLQTVRRLRDTGLRVRDIEFLTLGPETGPGDWRAMLDDGAALGATSLSCVGADPDRQRLTDTLAALTEDAMAVGIRPTLEPISYQPVSTVAGAAEIAAPAGAALLLDALHIHRGGSSLDDVRALDPDLVPCLQICDAPLAAPEHIELPPNLPMGMKADGSVLQVEARAHRLVAGEGELPLAELIAAVPEGVPLSVEVPHAVLQNELSSLEFARRNLDGLRRVLATADSHV